MAFSSLGEVAFKQNLTLREYGSGLIQFQAIHSFNKEIQAKAIIHATNKCWSMYQGDIGYKGKDFSLQLTGVNASIINPQGIWVAHYMQVDLILVDVLCYHGNITMGYDDKVATKISISIIT